MQPRGFLPCQLSSSSRGSLGWLVNARKISQPLVGWLHQWFDTARDGTQQIVAGYGSSLLVTVLWAIPFYLIATIALIQIAREEGANTWTLASPAKNDLDASNKINDSL